MLEVEWDNLQNKANVNQEKYRDRERYKRGHHVCLFVSRQAGRQAGANQEEHSRQDPSTQKSNKANKTWGVCSSSSRSMIYRTYLILKHFGPINLKRVAFGRK